MKNKILAITEIILCLCIFCSCTAEDAVKFDPKKTTRELFAMDTIMTITAYGDNSEKAVDEAVQEIQRLDKLLSVGDNDSEVSKINASGGGILSNDCRILTQRSLDIYRTTDGAYDITVYPLMELWGFTGDEPALPDDEDIQNVLSSCGSDKLTFDNKKLTLGENQGIDFGGIAKGYTSSRIMEIFKKYDILSGIVSLGGNVQCFDTKPDGSFWRCGITDPDGPQDSSKLLGVVEVMDKAVITSGGYERYFKDDKGYVYHHIMDMQTGYPSQSDLSSVTVVSNDGTLADALSTACFVMGKDNAIDYWKKYSNYTFDLVLCTKDKKLFITDGLTENFTSEYDYEIVNS